jgi:hypothetical protein
MNCNGTTTATPQAFWRSDVRTIAANYCKAAWTSRKFPQNFVATTRKLGY